MYEKLGLLEEKDLKAYYAKYGIKSAESLNEEELKEELEGKSRLGKKRQRSRFARKKEHTDKEHFLSMAHDLEI